jgi:pimeloyl-ACP methyl ester carboxylesterase
MQRRVPQLKEIVLVPGAGHFVQQEAPAAVNAALVKFLRNL